ncbi:hypothetical protein G6F57_015557 [Rhizopus arrhizus]|nr:hypothetical protein G6F57_015557 [Rhizopus arrhizus]
MPALGMDTFTPSAMTGSRPMGENSVTPMPNAPTASANNGRPAFTGWVSCGFMQVPWVRSRRQGALGRGRPELAGISGRQACSMTAASLRKKPSDG